ncbi:E3 ubiquitin-protein ligase dtx4 [Plakobranchus ocellatus]|uniref:E3 ubiquitin-protein ligase n=1 Tax=Plakobranchus ocellatus TaxID=259542 RepID=A0AAV4ARA3_9GAST|nr:E3 ubiquitin-protein ligase dtx4 [Plakobranchus ocellatus]
MAIIVWACRNDYHNWTPYPPEVSNGIEEIVSSYQSQNASSGSSALSSDQSQTASDGTSTLGRIPLGYFSPSWTGYEIDIPNMMQCQANSGRRFDIHRYVLDKKAALSSGFVWEFEGDTASNWYSYDLSMMTYIEAAYTKANKSRSKKKQPLLDLRKSLNLPYVIDVIKLEQTRMDTGKMRNIRRRPSTQPYTADTSGSVVDSHVWQAPSLPKVPPARRRMTKNVLTLSALQNACGGAIAQQSSTGTTKTQQLTATAQQPTAAAANQSVPTLAAATAKQSTSLQGAISSLKSVPAKAVQQPKAKQMKQTQDKSRSSPKKGATAQARESLPSENNIRISTKKQKPLTAKAFIGQYTTVVDMENKDEDSDEEEDEGEETETNDSHGCCICCDDLSSPSGYGEGDADASTVVQLNRCHHKFHRLCLLEMYRATHKSESLQCPSCKLIYGEKTGNCPAGVMTWAILKGTSVAGYEKYDTISVSYDIQPGVQGPEHPNPGRHFFPQGFPRIGYLPDTNEGRKVLKLMIEAWRRRLMFTVGTSYTTGCSDVVTWNEIHHKTELHGNYSGHGYPDPTYLANVILELADHGVTEDCFSFGSTSLSSENSKVSNTLLCDLAIVLVGNKFRMTDRAVRRAPPEIHMYSCVAGSSPATDPWPDEGLKAQDHLVVD